MWESFGFIALGIGVGLVGQRFRALYFRDFADHARADMDPVYETNASLMRRGAAIFLTTGVMMLIVGLYLAANEIWGFLRQG